MLRQTLSRLVSADLRAGTDQAQGMRNRIRSITLFNLAHRGCHLRVSRGQLEMHEPNAPVGCRYRSGAFRLIPTPEILLIRPHSREILCKLPNDANICESIDDSPASPAGFRLISAGCLAAAFDPKRTLSYDCQPCFPGSDPSRPSLTVWGLSSLPLRHHCSAASIGDGYGGRTNGSRSKPRNSLLDATTCASPSASCIAARVRRLSLPKAYRP